MAKRGLTLAGGCETVAVMKTPVRIVWLTPYRPGRVAPVIRGIRKYDTEADAQAQIARYQAVFSGNRYSVEPVQ